MAGEQGLYNPITEPYVRQLLSRADSASYQPYTPYPGARIAGNNADMNAAAGGIRSLGIDMSQATNWLNRAGNGLANETNFQSGYIGNTYTPRAVSMFARPNDSNMYARPDTLNMFNRPQDAQMYSRPMDTQMFAHPGNVGMFARPDNVKSDFKAGEFDSEAMKKYMSPYQQGVTDIAKREAERMFAAQAAQRDVQAAQRGSFGGSRNEIAQTEARRNENQLLDDIQTKGLQSAFMNAQEQYERDRQGRALEGQMGLDASKFNSNMGLQYGLAGTDVGKFNADLGLRYGQTGLQNQQFNTANAYQYGRDDLARQQFNADLGMRYGLAGLDTGKFNISTAQQYGRDDLQRQQYNSDLAMRYGLAGVDVGKYNETQRMNAGDMSLRASIANEAARAQAAGLRQGAYTGMTNIGRNFADIGKTAFDSNLQRYNALANIGQLQQQTQQRALDTAYSDWQTQQNWNRNNINYMAGILNSQPINPTYSYSTAPQQQEPSRTSQLLGLGIAGLGAYNAFMR